MGWIQDGQAAFTAQETAGLPIGDFWDLWMNALRLGSRPFSEFLVELARLALADQPLGALAGLWVSPVTGRQYATQDEFAAHLGEVYMTLVKIDWNRFYQEHA